MLDHVNSIIMRLREEGRFGGLSNKELRDILTAKASRTELHKPTLGNMFRTVIATKTNAPRTSSLYKATLKKLDEYCNADTTSFEDINRQ